MGDNSVDYENMDENECEICCSSFNKTKRKPVECHLCNEKCCMTCFKTYLRERETPECMFCKKNLSLSFVAQITPKSFHNKEYRECRASILLSKERSLLPETQNEIVQMKETNKFFNDCREKIARLKEEEMSLRALLKETIREIKETKEKMMLGPGHKVVKKRKFTMACPDPNCRGFLSEKWKCGVCDAHVCKHCHVIKEPEKEHECKKEDVETAKMIMKETKGCPKCGVRIYKIDGCDQMWCVECKTPFSWRTGKIVKGVIHNPHYYQWQREINNGVIPRNPGDNPCGGRDGDLHFSLVQHALARLKVRDRKELENSMTWAHQFMVHTRHVEIPRYTETLNGVERYKDLRLKYLLNKIDEKKWRQTLKARQKRSEKHQEILQIFEMLVPTLHDLFMQFFRKPDKKAWKMFTNIRNYANKEFEKIGNTYANAKLFIDKGWFIRKI